MSTPTRAQQRKAKTTLEANLSIRAFVDVTKRIERLPDRLKRRVLLAATTLYLP